MSHQQLSGQGKSCPLLTRPLPPSPPSVCAAGTDRQLPWATLARLLAGKGFGAEAVATVREGLREGLVLDADVAAAYLKGLCDTGQLVRMWAAGCWCARASVFAVGGGYGGGDGGP